MSNQLLNELSPYLQMHKDQPIHWYPWGEKAFSKAKSENKPIFLSIGYSTCHWCHVMAEESFEDEEIASLLNKSFISIKVDREENPDVDAVYMNVCQNLTGSGGWPLSLFLTPEQKPFFAGTYFPKRSNGNRIGFLELLGLIAERWENNAEELEQQAAAITMELMTEKEPQKTKDSGLFVEKGIVYLENRFDEENGGFGFAPKFPTPQNLLFLADCYETNADGYLLEIMEKTLIQMAKGGLFDHIGGGFCRYSTDEIFLVPHFEKMLYDNALLILAYAKGYELTKNEIYKNVAEKTASFLCRAMKSTYGGFYAAQDADIDGEEGKYYLFTPKEICSILGEEAGNDFNRRYHLSEHGNFVGKNIPHLLNSQVFPEDFAIGHPQMDSLLQSRERRYTLFTDEKILTSWNSMAMTAFVSLYRVTEKEIYLSVAEEIQRDILKYAASGYYLLRGHRDEEPLQKGTADDYAWFIHGLLALYQGTLNEKYFRSAKGFCEEALQAFFDYENGGFRLRDKKETALILEIKEVYDHAYPCANSVMAENLRQLYQLTDDSYYRDILEKQVAFIKNRLSSAAYGSFYFLLTCNRMEHPPKKVICAGRGEDDYERIPIQVPLRDTLLKKTLDPEYPLLNEKPTFYVCDEFKCLPPTNELII